MNEDDYRAILAVLEEELRESGAADIAAERHYMERDPETGDARLLDPRKRSVLMLAAFGRFLAIQDRKLATQAFDTLAEFVVDGSPRRAVVELATDAEYRLVDLSDAADLSELRADIARLMRRLAEGRLRDGGELA
ncbi:hypothetical protein [Sphingomonas sanguinis]|uniref:Uncharacterized protein n=1 Tax=Sphingomonas sanguinis TaxID=33051 RepID=A0A147ILL5_9SPHN|nr:hypothetical protein [Sphingomonas sanguinis]KTT96135.1 hypothetical protein SB4_16315 [Sphingomonas sanguinis]